MEETALLGQPYPRYPSLGEADMKSLRTASRGFTLIELLLVMVILTVLAGVVVTNFLNKPDQARRVATRTTAKNVEAAINLFQIDCGRLPTNDEGIDALLNDPGIAGWNGPYLQEPPLDGWGRPFQYTAPGEHLPRFFDVASPGPDGQPGTPDDIGNWRPAATPTNA
jgi:general secretion pathway protein G